MIFLEALRHFLGRQCRNLYGEDVYTESTTAKTNIIASTCPPDVEGWEDDRRDFMIAKYREKMRRVAFSVDEIVRRKSSVTTEFVAHGIVSHWYLHKVLSYRDPLETLS